MEFSTNLADTGRRQRDEVVSMYLLLHKPGAFCRNIAQLVYEGNSVSDTFESFDWIRRQQEDLVAVPHRTQRGRGVSLMEDNACWHRTPIDDASLPIPEL